MPASARSLLTTDPMAGRSPLRKPVYSSGCRVALLLELHVADDGQFVRDLRLEREKLADVHAGDVCLDRLELAAVLDRSVRLQIIHIDVTWPAVEVDHDDGLAGGGAGPPAP